MPSVTNKPTACLIQDYQKYSICSGQHKGVDVRFIRRHMAKMVVLPFLSQAVSMETSAAKQKLPVI